MNNLQQINISQLLPYRYPFLFIDAIEEFVFSKKMVAVKNVSANEKMLVSDVEGLFFPPMLVAEAAAQAVLLFSSLNHQQDPEQKLFFLSKITGQFFKRVVVGDRLKMIVERVRVLRQGGYADVEVTVDGETAAKIEVFFMSP